MPLAAIYARKSNEQNVADEDKSVTRQIELARACAMRRGFEVPQDHVYVDDAISGAEFDRRPGLMRLLNAIRPRAPFAALVLADKDRLGREQFVFEFVGKASLSNLFSDLISVSLVVAPRGFEPVFQSGHAFARGARPDTKGGDARLRRTE